MSNFAGNESYESTVRYALKSRISPIYLRLASVFTLVFVLGVGNVWGVTYNKVTDVSTLASGDEIIIVNESEANALSTTQNTNNRGAQSVTISSSSISDPDANVQVITLGTATKNSTTYWTFSVGTNKWLYAASSSKNYLKTQTTLDDNGKWSISISSGNATITAQGTNTRNLLKYNSNDDLFSCYSSGQQAVQIYKKAVASCSNKVALTKGTPSNGTFSLNKSNGSYDNCDENFVVTVSDISANTGYYCSGVTATGGNSEVTGPDGSGNYTVTYTKGNNITSTITANFAAKTARTVTFMNNGAQYGDVRNLYDGDAVGTLPTAPSSCKVGKVFVGWSETNIGVTPTDVAPSFISASTVVSGGNKVYYAVFATSDTPEDNLFEWEGGTASDLTNPDDVTASGLGSDYAVGNAPYRVKFDTEGDYINIKLTSQPKDITIGVKMVGGADASNIIIKEATALNEAFTNVETLAISGAQNSIHSLKTSNAFKSTTRVVQIYFNKGNGSNVGVGPIVITPATAYSGYITDCCTELGSINGSVNLTQEANGANAGKLTASWPAQGDKTGWADNGLIVKIYEDGNSTPVHTSSAISKNDLSYTATTFDPEYCTTYYATLTPVKADNTYCEGVESTEYTSVTTKGQYTYHVTLDGMQLKDGEEEAADNCSDFLAKYEPTGTNVLNLTEVSVTNAGEEGTGWIWDDSDGSLLVDKSYVTGNVEISLTGNKPEDPIVTPSTSSLNFGTDLKMGDAVPTFQSFTISGSNLTADLAVASSNSSLYAVSVTSGSLTPTAGEVSATITVTPQAGITDEAGDKNATITISGGGLASNEVITASMTVLQTYTVNWYVNGMKIDDNSVTDIEGTDVTAPSDFSDFTDCVPDFHFIGWATSAIEGGSDDEKPALVTPITAIGTANVDYYAVFAEGTPASTTKLLNEDFTACTGTGGNNTDGWSGNIASANIPEALTSTWTFENSKAANGCVKCGTSSLGTATTPELALTGAATLTFKAAAWDGKSESTNLKLSAEGATLKQNNATISSVTMEKGEWTSYTVDITGGNGEVTIKFEGNAAGNARFFLDDVVVSQAVAENFSKYYTTCPHVSRVTLSAASVENGSISFEQSGSAVTNVRTDGGEDVNVDVVPDPATGYELTGVALSGTAASHASYDAGVITIDAGTEGALTATATFAQANYTVTMAQTGGASAELSADQTNKHYNDVITVTAEDKAGYVFKGWSASPAVTFANAKALSTTFSMPNGNVTVTAAYEVIHDVAWALANTPGSGSSDSVYVKGLISKKEKLENDNTISYWISDNGQHTTGSVLEVYKGKGVNKVTFSSLDDLNVGDAVVVRGKLKTFSGTKEFDQGNYLYSRTAASLSSVAIGGSAEKTAYSPSDNTFSFDGLTATATYNTGYVKDVTAEATWTANSSASYTVAAGGDVTVRATFGGQYDEEVVTVTYTTKTVKAIYLEYESTYTFKGMDLPKPKVYAKYVEEIDDDEITSLVVAANGYDTENAYDKNTPGSYTINVGYESFNAEYTVQVRKIFDNEDAPHNVADADALITAVGTGSESSEYMWVRGIVCGFDGSYYNRYYISDNGTAEGRLYVYYGKYFNDASFDANNKLKVGDVVILKAKIKIFSSTNELTSSQVTYQLREPEFTFADVVAGDEFEAGFSADMTVEPTSNEGEAEFTLSSGNTDAVTIVVGKLHAVAEGDAVITASRAATDNTGSINYKAKNATFNVHVIAERKRYAIMMDADGGTGTDPVYDNQLAGVTVDLPADNTYSKANSAFDAWVVTETVSGDAVAVTDGHFTMPAAAVTIKATWNEVETCHISFRVSGSEVATADAPQTTEYTITQTADDVNGYEFVGWAESEENTDVETVLTTISSYTPALNEDSKILYAVFRKSVEGGEVTDEITNADLAATGSGYVAFDDVTISTSAVYAGTTSKSNGIQMNADSPKGMVTITTGGLLKNISIEWNSNCAADRVLDVYAKNTAYAGSSDLWGAAAAQGTKVTSFTNDGSTTSYDFTADYAYIGVRSNDKALNIDRISITWETEVLYYTTNPVAKYNIKYRAGDAENVTGLCDADRTWGTITLCDAPTCEDKVFAKWSDGSSLYNAGAEYTLSADVTFTATWTPKPKYTVTYTANGGTGTAPAVEEYLEGATVTVKENEYFSKPGFVYAGWQVVYNDGVNNHEITPDEDSKFEMVAYNVTIKALWEEPSNQKWVRVESTDELDTVNGTNYIIVASQANAAMGALNGAVYNSIGIVKTGNYLNGPESMTKVTLAAGSEDGKYAIKNGTKYVYSTSAKSIGERDDSFDWTITIANGVATINAGTAGKLQFNTGNPRFTTYTSSQQAVAIYREKALTPINQDDMTEADVNTYDDVEIGQDKTWTVSGEIEVGDVYMKEGAVIANSATVTANDLYFKASYGKSNQIFDLSKITVVSNMYYDFQLCDGDVDANYWYSISVPFDVDLNSGVFQVGGTTPLVNRSDFEVWEYDPQKRADTQSNGWKRSSDNMMHAGKAYLIGFNPGQPNIIRLKAAAGWNTNLFSGTSMSVVSTGGSGTHDNWNGLANPTGRYIDVDKDAQVFNNNTHGWDSYALDAARFNFVVGTAFFVQSASAITIGNTDHGNYRAPKREGANESKCAYAVRITRNEATSFDNQIIVRASEDATSEYEQGHDMLTMNDATSKKAALLWTKNYGGKRLAIEEAPFVGDKASYELGIYAPANGTYFISVAEAKDNADLYLTYEGSIIWNLSAGAYEVELGKGATNGYGLMLVRKAPQVTTGVENVQGDKTQCTKVILNDHVYILRDAQLYDVTGKAVK